MLHRRGTTHNQGILPRRTDLGIYQGLIPRDQTADDEARDARLTNPQTYDRRQVLNQTSQITDTLIEGRPGYDANDPYQIPARKTVPGGIVGNEPWTADTYDSLMRNIAAAPKLQV